MTHHTTSWLDSLISHPEGIHKDYSPRNARRTYEERLHRMKKILDIMGNPQNTYKAVHITGTSGKGSVATMTAALLQQSNHTVGLHTSPYLQLPTEKIQLNGSQIATPLFMSYINTLKSIIGRKRPTYGQAWTALVHLVFKDTHMEWGICEARMGGRYDETNIINSRVAVITTVDYDHIKQLGPALTDIAWHKSGIIKQGIPAVTAVTNPDVLAVIEEEASKKGSKLYRYGVDFKAYDIKVHDQGITASFLTPSANYKGICVNLSGRYQAQNAACAIMAAQLALQEDKYTLTQKHVQEALKPVTVPGRFEIMQQSPLCVLDGAHNPAKISALSQLIAERYRKRNITLILGVLESKDAAATIAPILPFTNHIIATEPKVMGKRALSAHVLAKHIAMQKKESTIKIVTNPLKALNYALNSTLGHNDLILVTGSLYLVGNIREHWHPT